MLFNLRGMIGPRPFMVFGLRLHMNSAVNQMQSILI